MEKATELGVTDFYPLQTERSITTRFNQDRAQDHIKGATEQCERCDLPVIHPLSSLEEALKRTSDPLLACLERNLKTLPIAQALTAFPSIKKAGIVIGPEGGFSLREQELLQNSPLITPVSLGPLILRAETAGIAALSVFQAVRGNWTSIAL